MKLNIKTIYINVPPYVEKHGQQFSIHRMNSTKHLINNTALINNCVTCYLSIVGLATRDVFYCKQITPINLTQA